MVDMKNFVFISPNYPANYWQFCRALKEQGFRVLGIGDAPRDSLDQQLLEQLSDYQQVSAIDCFEEMQAAVARYVDAYGPMDWLESNNEYWLGQDARLRSAFHLESGFQQEELPTIRSKSLMKPIYQQAGIPVARYHVVDDFKHCAAFAAEVGYPVVVKPDTVSKKASTKLGISPEKTNGKHPNTDITTQESPTITNPSLTPRVLSRGFIATIAAPRMKSIAIGATNGIIESYSPYISATASGSKSNAPSTIIS